jgi:hypothetical protein
MNNSNKPERKPNNGFVLLSLILGIISIISWFLLIRFESRFSPQNGMYILGLIALFSFIGLIFGRFMTPERRALAKWGITLCSIGLFLSFVIWTLASFHPLG